MRAIAALGVFFCHLAAYWDLQQVLPHRLGSLTELGAHGVDLFVVISGFCLALPVARTRHLDNRTFFIRRATRIIPPYYLALAVCAVLAMAPTTTHLVVARPATGGEVLAHFLFVQTLIPGAAGTVNGSFWSIALEIQLYLVFPLTVLIWRRFGSTTLVALAALISLGWEALESTHLGVLGDNRVLPDRYVQFAVGVLVADWVVRGRPLSRRWLWCGLSAGLLASVAASTADVTGGNAILWSVPSACAILLAVGRFRHPVLGSGLEWLGKVSFSFYLLQQPVLLLTSGPAHRLTKQPLELLALGSTVCLALMIVLSVVAYRFVERPASEFGLRRTRGRSMSRPVPVDVEQSTSGSAAPVRINP